MLSEYILFNFNEQSALLLPFVIQGIVMTFLLIRRGKDNARKADIILGFLLLIYTLRIANWMLGFAGWYDSRDWHTSFMFYFPFNHWLAVGPLIYFYFRYASNHLFTFKRKHLLHAIPWGLAMLQWFYIFGNDIIINHWLAGELLPEFYNTRGIQRTKGLGFLGDIWPYLETLSVVFYVIFTLRLFNKYRSYINDNFSDTENIDLKWLRNFLIVNLIGTAIWVGFNVANVLLVEPLSYAQDWYSFFFLGIILYYLSITGYHYGGDEKITNELNFIPDKRDIVSENDESDEEILRMEALYEKVQEAMKNDQLFLNPSLNLKELANRIKCNSGVLSKTINQCSNKNFNDFINNFRIETFKEKAADPQQKQYSLLALAFDSGFNSKATFNRAFKKETGMSPSAYIKTIDTD